MCVSWTLKWILFIPSRKKSLKKSKKVQKNKKIMNFKFLKCYHRQKHPKINVASRKSVKKKSSSKKRHKKSKRPKNSYISSNIFSKNFYPANYFFQDDYRTRIYDTRVGVNDQNGFLITTRNTPQLPPPLPRKNPPSRANQQHQTSHNYLSMKVG